MNTKFVEVTNGPHNHGKFMLGQFEQKEWEYTSRLPGDWPLLAGRGWAPSHLMVFDLQTGEGAIFLPGGLARADLNKHKVWVCPLFEPFLEFLWDWPGDPMLVPDYLDLPDAPFAMAGYRREGR